MLECLFEGDVAQGVAGGVDGAVDVAQPVADGPHGVGDAAGAEGVDQHHDVVRSPGGHKRHKDGHNCARDLFFSRRSSFLLLVRWLLRHLYNLACHVVLTLSRGDNLYSSVGCRSIEVILG